MGMFVRPPFALFVLVDVDIDIINSILDTAREGSTVDLYLFSLISSLSYDAAPQKKPEGGGQTGTETPIDPSFSSPFIGKNVEEVAEWLKGKPKTVDVEGKFFAVLDKKANDSKVVLCRIGDKQGNGDEVQCVLWPAEQSTLELSGIEYGNWEELVEGGGLYTPDV